MAGFYFYDPRPFYSPAELFNPWQTEPNFEFGKREVMAKDVEKKEVEKKEVEEKPKNQTVEIRVHFCCDNVANKVEDIIKDMEGVVDVDCCQSDKKVTVIGDVKPEHVLKRVQKVWKDAELLPKKRQS